MPSFDFVTDDRLRVTLESDARELQACLDAQAYKAVHVLAGSIVEAVLLDHLESSGVKPVGSKTFNEMQLGQLIDSARAAAAITATTADLSSAVRNYRNLIHAGRSLRTGERVSASTANIALSLVEVVTADLASAKKSTYGYTASELLAKVEGDASSFAILGSLMEDTRPEELEKLLARALPERYLLLASDEYYRQLEESGPTLARLGQLFRVAFDTVDGDCRARVMAEYAQVVRKEVDAFPILTREEAFFHGSDLEYLNSADATMVKKHLLGRIGRTFPEALVSCLDGLAPRLSKQELAGVMDAIVRRAALGQEASTRKLMEKAFQELWVALPTARDKEFREYLDRWAGAYPENSSMRQWLAGIAAAYQDDLPF